MSKGKRQDDAANGEKKRRWLWPLLIISLGLNLLFVGLVAGRIWSHGYGGHAAAPNRIFTGAIEQFMKQLPAAKRRRATEFLERHRASVRPLRKQIREARRAAEAAVLADEYNEEKVAQAFGQLRTIEIGRHQSMHTMMMDLLKDLTLNERQKLVKLIHAGFRHRRRPWRHPHGMRGPPQ